MNNKNLKNKLTRKIIAFLTIFTLLLNLIMPSYVLAEDIPTIKLNLNDTFTINPYDYVHKDYKNKELNFNITKANVATMALVENSKKIVFTGKAEGDSVFTISSEGRELYKININVNPNNRIETSNLNPVENNANTDNENIDPNGHIIKLNINGVYSINPYNYIHKDYKNKEINFNITDTNVVNMNLDRETKNLTLKGLQNGNSILTISSEGKELYKININVNETNTIETNNLDPIENNAASNDEDTSENIKPNMPTIKLNVNGNYTIRPYDYVPKEYQTNGKRIHFNMSSSNIAKMSLNRETKEITFTGVSKGSSEFTISSEGKELYKIDIKVNDKYTPEALNLNPVNTDNNQGNNQDNNQNGNGNNNGNQPGNKDNNIPNPNPDNGNNNTPNPEPKPNTDNNENTNMPTVKLKVDKDYTIDPYDYVHKDYKYKQLDFNIANTSVAKSSLNKETKLITFKGIGNGNTIFTISSEGKELYKINIDVNDKNIVGVSNLDPIKDNANTPDNNNNNNNNNNQNQKPDNNKPDNKPNPVPDNNKNNQGNGNNNQNQQPNINNNPGKQDNGSVNNHEYGNRYVPHNNSGNGNNDNIHQNNGKVIGSNDRETTPIPPTSDPLAESGYYTPKGETPNNPEKPNNVDLSKNPNTKPVNPTPNNVKPNVIPRSGLDYTIYGAIILGISFAGFVLTKYLKYNKMVKQAKIK